MFDTSQYQVIKFHYDDKTRVMALHVLKGKPIDRYGGSTIDSNSVLIEVDGIPEKMGDAWLEFAVSIVKRDRSTFRPTGPLVKDTFGPLRYYIVQQAVLEAAFRLKKLPIQLVMRTEDVIINSRNQITLEIGRSINALATRRESYENMMFKGDSWSWCPTRVYSKGSVVTYNNDIFISTADANVDNEPTRKSVFWRIPGDEAGRRFKTKSFNFECVGTIIDWSFGHGFGTKNFVWSIRDRATDEYIFAHVSATDDNTVAVQFTQERIGKYTLNLIACEDSVDYEQRFNFMKFENKTDLCFREDEYVPLPKYVQIYDSDLIAEDPTVGNEIIPMIMQNPEEGYSHTDVYFWGGKTLENHSGHAVFVTPDDNRRYYFTNTGCTKPAEIFGLQAEYHLIQLYDTDTDERLFADITQTDSGIKIEMSSDRNFVAVLIKPTEEFVFSGGDRDWVYSLLNKWGNSKYGGRVVVQCFDSSGKLLYPSLYVDDKKIKAMYNPDDNGNGPKGRMLISGDLLIGQR